MSSAVFHVQELLCVFNHNLIINELSEYFVRAVLLGGVLLVVTLDEVNDVLGLNLVSCQPRT